MTAVTRPRGPLPARVYWTRRVLLLVLPLALVYAVAHLLGAGGVGGPGAGSPAEPVAAQSSAASSSAASSSTAATGPTTPAVPTATASLPVASGKGGKGGKGGKAVVPLPEPSGTCASTDLVVAPSAGEPSYAGRSVVLTMTLTTRTSLACTWTVSPTSLVVKVTSGQDRVWSTQDCVGAVPEQTVVVRKDTAVTVPVTWNGQRSDTDCSRSTPWAEPGYYHVVAAAFGSQPADEQFELVAPPRPTVTATPTPDRDARVKAAQQARLRARAEADRKAHLTPSATPHASPKPSPQSSPKH